MTLIMEGGVLVKISLIVSIGAMVLLYLIGFIAHIDFLVFKISLSGTEIALLPITVGLLIAFIFVIVLSNTNLKNIIIKNVQTKQHLSKFFIKLTGAIAKQGCRYFNN